MRIVNWVGAAAALALVTGCAGGGGGFGTSNQVVVSLDGDISDIPGATATAERQCASRGGHARFVLLQSTSSGGSQNGFTQRPPAAVFTCDPAAGSQPAPTTR